MSFGCATGEVFPQLEDQIAGPTSIAIDADNNRLYLVNANEKVEFDWRNGSFQVYDITDPLNPVLIKTTHIFSFSGKVSIDTVRKRAYLPNRFSEEDEETTDRFYIFNIDESSADFLTFEEIVFGVDPFGIVCCYPADRLWVAEGGRKDHYMTQYLDKDGLKVGDINLLVDLVGGGSFDSNETSDLAIIGQMGFYSRSRGGILVLNLAEADVAGAEPVDYWIADIRTPRGIATDGTYIYIASEEQDDGEWKPRVFVIDPSSLVPLTDNTAAQELDKEDDGLLVATIDLNDRRDPQEILLTDDYILVTTGWNEDNFIMVADRNNFSLVKEVATGEEPFPMALYAPGGVEKYVYVANQISNTIQVLDLATLNIVATFSGP